ncbi:MAG: hypothetical protein Q8Q02_16380 [Nocardioides sp.]|nr:hypothetical protein [Nocardioides sp.]
MVTLAVIDGHRDTNDTACPGQHLYDAFPAIRRRTKRRVNRYHQRAVISEPFTGSGRAVMGATLPLRSGSWTPAETTPTYIWLREGARIAGATAATYRLVPADVG